MIKLILFFLSFNVFAHDPITTVICSTKGESQGQPTDVRLLFEVIPTEESIQMKIYARGMSVSYFLGNVEQVPDQSALKYSFTSLNGFLKAEIEIPSQGLFANPAGQGVIRILERGGHELKDQYILKDCNGIL